MKFRQKVFEARVCLTALAEPVVSVFGIEVWPVQSTALEMKRLGMPIVRKIFFIDNRILLLVDWHSAPKGLCTYSSPAFQGRVIS